MIDRPRPSGFTILEVLFAVTFLVLIGTAMGSLGTTALKLTDTAEVKTIANALNEESLVFIGLKVKAAASPAQKDALRTELYNNSEPTSADCPKAVVPDGSTCYRTYINCPLSPLEIGCQFSDVRTPVQPGVSRLQYSRVAEIRWPANSVTAVVTATTTWGGGTTRSVTTGQRYSFE